MFHARDLVARDSLSPLLHYFLKRTFGYQRISQFATERRGVSLQCREGDIAFGFGPLCVHDCGLGHPHGLGELARGHAQCLSYRAKPAAVRSGAWQTAPRGERLIYSENAMLRSLPLQQLLYAGELPDTALQAFADWHVGDKLNEAVFAS